MLKADVFSFGRVPREAVTRTFTEPSTGDALTITLRAQNAADAAIANEKLRRLVEDYITGSEIREAGPFPDPEVRVSRELFLTWATIEQMQPEPVYDAIELIIATDRAPTIGNGILQLAAELNTARASEKKTSPEASMAPSPDLSSTSATNTPS